MIEPSKPSKRHINAELPPDAVRELVEMARAKGVTVSEALRRAIVTEAFLQKKRDIGGKVLIDVGGKIKELVFDR